VRYYGGIQLGASGLIRAYRLSVVEAIKQAHLTQMSEMIETVCSLDYAQLDQKLLAIEKISAIQHKDFDEMVILTLHSSEDIQTKLTEITNGQIKIISISIKEVENEIHKELNYE
jgi:putative IMPACT (imprinted ancient) family translation regulator